MCVFACFFFMAVWCMFALPGILRARTVVPHGTMLYLYCDIVIGALSDILWNERPIICLAR